jgi:hypothetical protein
MADFCKQCSVEMFGEDFGDLANLCAEGQRAHVICEGCGFTVVDKDGICVSDMCLSQHKT